MYINLITIDLCPGQNGGGVNPSGTLNISENGEYDVYSYASASVNVPTPAGSLYIKYNRVYDVYSYSKAVVDVHPDEPFTETYVSNGSYTITGEFKDGMVTVNVPSPQFVTESLSVSANGTYTPGEGVDGYSQVVVDVPAVGFDDQKSFTEGTVKIINNSASFVASSAFTNNKTIQTVNLPYATSIGSGAFANCSLLSQVSLPVCSFIDQNAFRGCSSLSQVSLPVCSIIGSNGFINCSSLSQVSLPVCSLINQNAFAGCFSLSQVSLPVCSIIGNYAFNGCSSLSIITIGYPRVCSLVNTTTLNNTQIASGTGSIYVPASLVDAYKSAKNWSVYSSRIFPISE